MKTITIDVSDPVYREFQEYAHKLDRPTSEIIREAMQLYRDERIRARQSLRTLKPLSLGKVLRPLERDDDLLEEMLGG
jgi:hypothetical protein